MPVNLERYLDNTRTVADLIEMLQDFDPKAKVVFATNSGDYWNTEVAHSIDEISEGMVSYSERLRMLKTDDNDDDSNESSDGEADKTIEVIVIR